MSNSKAVKLEMSKIKKKTVVEEITEQIINMVKEDKLKPGTRLPSERELASILSVGRPAVREAMGSLKAMGIVDIRTGDGTYLVENNNIVMDQFQINHLLKKYSILELVEARKIFEVEIVGFAAERATNEQKIKINNAYEKSVKSRKKVDEFLLNDLVFHLSIAEAAQNRFLLEMLNMTRELLLETSYKVVNKKNQIEIVLVAHKKILDAINNSDPATAKKEMLYHLETVELAVKELYQKINISESQNEKTISDEHNA